MSETPNAMRFLDEQRARAKKKKAQRKGTTASKPNRQKGETIRAKKFRLFNKPLGKVDE
jgi:hypothetical protein